MEKKKALAARALASIVVSLGQRAADLLALLYTRVDTFQSMPSIGRIWGKKSASPSPHKTRCITPVPNLFDPLDNIIAARADNLGDHIRSLLGRGVLEGARPKTQPADVTFPFFGLFQHAMDDHSKGAVAGGDIEKYYDNVKCTSIASICVKDYPQARPESFIAPMLLLHCFLPMKLSFSMGDVVIPYRTRGIHQGSKSANKLQRIPTLDSILQVSATPDWSFSGYLFGDLKAKLALFIDNLYSLGTCSDNAVHLLSMVEESLQTRWQLRFSDDSKFTSQAPGNLATYTFCDYPLTDAFSALGHTIAHDGNCCGAFIEMRRRILSAVHCLAKPAFFSTGYKTRLRLVNARCLPHIRYMAPVLALSPTRFGSVDGLHAHVMRIAFPIPVGRQRFMSDAEFFRARSIRAGKISRAIGQWSFVLADTSISWLVHCRRAVEYPHTWCGHVVNELNIRGQVVDLERSRRSSTNTSNTGTRALRARPCTRYHEHINHCRLLCAAKPSPDDLISIETFLLNYDRARIPSRPA